MKLYTKGERRYSAATASEVLEEASNILSDLGVNRESAVLFGMSRMMKAQGDYEKLLEAKRIDEQKSEDRSLSKPPKSDPNRGKTFPAESFNK